MGTSTHCRVCGSKPFEHTDPSMYHDQRIYPHTDQRKLPEHTDPSMYHDQRIYPHTDQHITQERYKVLAQEIERDIGYISDKSQPKHSRLARVNKLRGILYACLYDENLDHLTRIYRDTHPHTKVHVGYNHCAVTAFAMEMLRQYT